MEKFWKSKNHFEKSNGEILKIKSHLRNQTRNKINQIKLLSNQNLPFQESKDKKKIKTKTFCQ